METLDLRYRPKTYSDVIGQEGAISLLQGPLVQSYILSGPSGTGKTTLARIFGKELDYHIYEFDANTLGKQDILSLRPLTMSKPLFNEGNMFIIDEAHTLPSQAKESLLKLLEESPKHNVWVLCTTSPQSIIDTIKTRSREVPVLPVSKETLKEHLKYIWTMETKRDIPYEEIEQIAVFSQGGVRRAIKNLETFLHTGTLVLPVTHLSSIELVTAIYAGDTENIKNKSKNFAQEDLKAFGKFIAEYMEVLLLFHPHAMRGDKSQFPHILENESNIPVSLIDSLRDMESYISAFKTLPNSQGPAESARVLLPLLNLVADSYQMFGDGSSVITSLLLEFSYELRRM